MTTNLFNPSDKRSYPSRWSLHRGKQLFRVIDERTEKGTEELLSVSHITGVTPRSQKNVTMFQAESLVGYKLCQIGDIAANTMWTWQGAIGVSNYAGVVSPSYNVYRQNGEIYNPRFLDMLLRERKLIDVYHSLSTGIRPSRLRLYPEAFLTVRFPVPPRAEQDQIVRFLDWKVSSINRLINIRKQQIEELEEAKRSKIGHLVMGQSHSVPQKETSINWVKTIPAHWDEKSLIQVAEVQQIKNMGMIEDNLLSLSYGKIINKDINTTDGLLPTSFEGYQIVQDGNIILRLTDLQNDHRSLRTGLATQAGIITSAYTCLKVRDSILPEYLQLQLHVADLCKVFYGMGGGVRQSIGFKEIRKLIVATPPIEEQQRILNDVHGIEGSVNRAMQNRMNIIAELEDLKTRLISDVVTGKVDVRDIEIPEYEFMEEEAGSGAEDAETEEISGDAERDV